MGLLFPHPYYGVTDGVSGVYLPEEGPRLFDGLTGKGQIASQTVVETLCKVQGTLEERIWFINEKLSSIIEQAGLSLDDPAFLPGACFAVCEVGMEGVKILQGGDTLAVWQLKDGAVGGTPNKNFNYEKFLIDNIAELMQKHGGNRQKMWEEFRPILIAERRKYACKYCLCLLNGQPGFEDLWQRFIIKRDKLKLLILFSDGLVPFEKTRSMDELTNYVIDHYNHGSLNTVLSETRRLAKLEALKTHETFQEATAIALEF